MSDMAHSYGARWWLEAAWRLHSSHGYGLFGAKMPSEKMRLMRGIWGAECEAEVMRAGDNPHFVVTSLEAVRPPMLYEDPYYARGNCANASKAVHVGLHRDRTL